MKAGDPRRKALAAWQTWYARCTLARCPEEAAALLRRFAADRFRLYVGRMARSPAGPDGPPAIPPPPEVWHRFETHLCLHRTRRGKAYKDWLFTRAAGQAGLDAVQGGATLILRDIVRDYLAREATPRRWTSLDQPVPGLGRDGPSLLDLLPGAWNPAEEAARRDLETRGVYHARIFAATLTQREKMAFTARAEGRPLSNPALLARTGCARSQLHRIHQKAVRRLARDLLRTYPREPRPVVMELALATLQSLGHALMEKKEGKSSAELSSIITGTPGERRRTPGRKEESHELAEQSHPHGAYHPRSGGTAHAGRRFGVGPGGGHQ